MNTGPRIILALWFTLLSSVSAQLSFTGVYTETFDTLNSTGSPLPPWADDVTLPGWYSIVRGSGGSYSSPATYFMGNVAPGALLGTNAGPADYALAGSTADRSFGLLSTSSTSTASQPVAIAVRLRNTTGATVSSLAISFTGKQWTQGYSAVSSSTTLTFSYSTNATALSNGTYTAVPALTFTSPVSTQTTDASHSVGLDGSLPANQVAFSGVVFTVAGGWAPGVDMWFRWSEPFTSGRPSGLAIDDLVISSGTPGAPVITVQPYSQSAAYGTNVTFAVAAVGSPTMTYQWTLTGRAIPSATNPSLTLTNVSAADIGTYNVVVANSVDSVTSDSADLTVTNLPGAPAITTQPAPRSVASGANVTFSVVATGSPAPTYQWRKDGVPIAGATGSSLTLTNVQAADAHDYDVVMTNSVATATSYAATLTVDGQLAPAIRVQPVSRSLGVGGSVSLRVIATGDSTLTYQWRKNGVAIAGATKSYLTFKNAQLADAGSYDVVLATSAGSIVSSAATLTVGDFSPAITRVVDQRMPAPYPYRTIASAIAATQAGDVIELAPGSGPYGENITILQSGAPDKPIVFEGNGELLSGFQPISFTTQGNGTNTFLLPTPLPQPGGNSNVFRYLITHYDQRLLCDDVNGSQTNIRFTKPGITLSSDGTTLILAPGVSATGWKIGGYIFNQGAVNNSGVELAGNSSYQTYRNLRVTGAGNDGFGIHGYCKGIVFENIEGFNNFDEGYSSHDFTHSEVYGGTFWGNDNGMNNQSKPNYSLIMDNIKSFSNLGFGINAKGGDFNKVSNVTCWDNGVQNLTLGGPLTLYNVVTYGNRWPNRPWVSFQETQNITVLNGPSTGPYALFLTSASQPLAIVGEYPVVRSASAPPLLLGYDDWRFILFTQAEVADDSISGPLADPDRDGLNNLLEYALGLNPKAPNLTRLTPAIIDGHLALSYPARSINTDIDIFAEVSFNLGGWSSDPLAVKETVVTGFEDNFGFEAVKARDLTPVAGTPAGFLRLRVERR